MIHYLLSYPDKLFHATIEHLQLILTALFISLIIAAFLTILCDASSVLSKFILGILSMIYSIPSLALLALLIPFSGLGKPTAIIALVIYNQYLLLGNFIAGLNEVDKNIVEAAAGMGMTKFQILTKIKLPLSKTAFIAGIRIAFISTVGIATIAASINAGGLGMILFDGLRTMNIAKILWGSILCALLALLADWILRVIERKLSSSY